MTQIISECSHSNSIDSAMFDPRDCSLDDCCAEAARLSYLGRPSEQQLLQSSDRAGQQDHMFVITHVAKAALPMVGGSLRKGSLQDRNRKFLAQRRRVSCRIDARFGLVASSGTA